MTNRMRTGLMALAVLLGTSALAGNASAQQAAPAPGGGRAPAGPIVPGQCPANVARPVGGNGAGTAAKRVLAWADSRNGIAQHEYVTYALAQLQKMGHDSKAYDMIIRTDSDIISFNPTMTDGKTPASGGPSLCNIDAIVFAGHRTQPLSDQQKKDLVAAIHDKGIGFVTLFIGMLPAGDGFPEMGNILGEKPASVDVHDPFGAAPIVNEDPNSPMTKHLPKVWNLAGQAAAVYQPDFYNRSDIHVLLRKDISKLAPVANYTRADGDYPVAWIKNYGKGKVFVSSIGNDQPSWDNKDLLTMYDQAIKWSVGLTNYDVKPHPLPADVKPPQGKPDPNAPAGRGRGGAGRGAAPAAN